MYRIMCDRIWEQKMKFGCCKQFGAVANCKFETETLLLARAQLGDEPLSLRPKQEAHSFVFFSWSLHLLLIVRWAPLQHRLNIKIQIPVSAALICLELQRKRAESFIQEVLSPNYNNVLEKSETEKNGVTFLPKKLWNFLEKNLLLFQKKKHNF